MACAHDENLFRPAPNFHRNVTLSFVIPTACNFFDFAQTRLLSEGRTVVERIGVPPPQQPPCPLTTVLSLSTTLPFVIPSEAEGSAVRFIGDKSQMEASPSPLSSRAKPRDLRFNGPFLEMFFNRSDSAVTSRQAKHETRPPDF
jgi:hypothetical protein